MSYKNPADRQAYKHRWELSNPERAKDLHRKHMRAYRQSHIQKQREQQASLTAVYMAVKLGRLTRPETCSECGGAERIQAHHHLGYAKTHRLDVKWLCVSCHHKLHHQYLHVKDALEPVLP